MLEQLANEFQNCMDYSRRSYCEGRVQVVYLSSLIGDDKIFNELTHPFSDPELTDPFNILLKPPFVPVDDIAVCIQGLLDGKAVVQYDRHIFLVDMKATPGRSIEESNVESIISGPHDSFVENVMQNISLIRSRIKSPQLKMVRESVGSVTNTTIAILYLDGMVNEEQLTEFKNKIHAIPVKAVYGSQMVTPLIEEHPNSIFPQFMTTERPDLACSHLVQGRMICLVDGSPTAFTLPSSFFDFFSSPEDFYQRFHIGTALKMLRFLGLFVSLVFTPLYVAVTTFHYEVIPFNMLLNLTESRRKVPFPPFLEALLMEITIEMLKEAGSRMPTKIGQTIGIVGGIVIGQAAVQAGFTSNILIIAVAVSAIASFVIPNYVMSTSIRYARFFLIVLASVWGMYGLVLGIGFLIVHLASISNLGTAYLASAVKTHRRDWIALLLRSFGQNSKNTSRLKGKK